jgi:small GTP-binding protein
MAVDAAPITLRIAVLGAMSVGKSTLVFVNEHGALPDTISSTVGCDFIVKEVERLGRTVSLQFRDMAGKQEYRISPDYLLNNAKAVVVVIDVSDEATLTVEAAELLQKVQPLAAPDAVYLLIANKVDLPTRVVSFKQGKEFADAHGMQYVETSCKDISSIQHAFHTLEQLLWAQMDAVPTNEALHNAVAQATGAYRCAMLADPPVFRSNLFQLHETALQKAVEDFDYRMQGHLSASEWLQHRLELMANLSLEVYPSYVKENKALNPNNSTWTSMITPSPDFGKDVTAATRTHAAGALRAGTTLAGLAAGVHAASCVATSSLALTVGAVVTLPLLGVGAAAVLARSAVYGWVDNKIMELGRAAGRFEVKRVLGCCLQDGKYVATVVWASSPLMSNKVDTTTECLEGDMGSNILVHRWLSEKWTPGTPESDAALRVLTRRVASSTMATRTPVLV